MGVQCGARRSCPLLPGRHHCFVPELPPQPEGRTDLVLCFGSDRFPVGWLPVVFSLSCTDENAPFCCEGHTMNAWLIYSVTWLY